MKMCKNCGEEINKRNARSVYCSKQCYGQAKFKRHYKKYGNRYGNRYGKNVCKKCNSEYNPTRRHQKYCGYECAAAAQRKYLSIPECLENASRKLDKKIGYVRVYCPMHPQANTWGYVYEHRLIMESILGRILNKEEHVHHINSIRWDNDPNNLKVLSSSEHSKITAEAKFKKEII
jgi:hypothetical protein